MEQSFQCNERSFQNSERSDCLQKRNGTERLFEHNGMEWNDRFNTTKQNETIVSSQRNRMNRNSNGK